MHEINLMDLENIPSGRASSGLRTVLHATNRGQLRYLHSGSILKRQFKRQSISDPKKTYFVPHQRRAPTLSQFCRRPPSCSTQSSASKASPSRWSSTRKTWATAPAARTPVTDAGSGLDWTGAHRTRTGPQARLHFFLGELDFARAAVSKSCAKKVFLIVSLAFL